MSWVTDFREVGLNGDTHVYTHRNKCPTVTQRPTATPKALNKMQLYTFSVLLLSTTEIKTKTTLEEKDMLSNTYDNRNLHQIPN